MLDEYLEYLYVTGQLEELSEERLIEEEKSDVRESNKDTDNLIKIKKR